MLNSYVLIPDRLLHRFFSLTDRDGCYYKNGERENIKPGFFFYRNFACFIFGGILFASTLPFHRFANAIAVVIIIIVVVVVVIVIINICLFAIEGKGPLSMG